MAAASAQAAGRLMRDRDAIAGAVIDALYTEHPEFVEHYGERGREKCLQDMRHNIDHLIPAVDMADDAMFARYVEWLDGLMRAYNVRTADVVRSLELLRDECRTRMSDDEGAATAKVIDAGLRVLVPA